MTQTKKEIKSTEGQRALIEAYESIKDLLPSTPPYIWEAWVREGQKQNKISLI